MPDETFTQRYDKALAAERLRPSKQHKEAMDYIYNRVEDSDEPGVHLAFEKTQSIMLELDEETHEIKCQKGGCIIEPYYEPVFVVGIYVNDVKEAQEFWCKKCAVEGMKWSNKHPLLKGDLS
jgi:histidinol dehydrogenase